MPRLSIVLVTHHEQGFLRRCLASVLAQKTDDVEVVVVDDASTDHTAEILADVATTEPGLRVHRLEDRAGPGPARAAALDLVSGQHVWFVEPTDLLPDGAVAAVLAHLGEPAWDVLVLDHVRRAYDARETAVPAPPGGTSALWDKVVAHDLMRAHAGELARDGGWEARTAWRLLLRAERVSVPGVTAYVRRVLPEPVRRRSDPRPPRDVVAAYEQLLSEVRQADPVVVAALFTTALRQLDDLPARLRPDFFAALARTWPSMGGASGLVGIGTAEQRALESGRYQGWQALRQTRRGRRRARGQARKLVREAQGWRRLPRRARRWPLQSYYRAQRRLPLDENLVVYGAYWYAAYSCNPRAIYEKAREIAPWLRGVWVVDADKQDRVPAGVETVVAGTRDYYRAMARATYLVNNVNFPNDIVKRGGQVHLQTHHGTPLKTMGLDLVGARYGRTRMNFDRLIKRVARWDFSISQNAFTTEQWERVYPGTYESLETGYPRNDVLANATAEQVAAVRAELGIDPSQTAVLYTPTHREYHAGFVPQLDPARLAKALGPDHVLLMRAHYFYGDSGVGGPATGVIDVADHPRIEDLYLAADVLVTDYSSVMFDYAVLDRPIVIFASDWDDYRTLRGTYFDLLAEPPGHVVTTEEDLAEVLMTRRPWDDVSAAYRQAFRARFCSLEDGSASERVVRRLWSAPVEEPR